MSNEQCDGAEVWLKGNTMLVRLLNVTDLSNDSPVTGGVQIDASIRDKDDAELHALSLANVSADGDWQAAVPVAQVDPGISVGDRMRIVFTLDGGTEETKASWTLKPEVQERRDD